MKLAVDSWQEEERAAVEAVLRSGKITMGEKVREFEAKMAARLKRQHAVMTNSGSSANLLAVGAAYYMNKLRGHVDLRGTSAIVPAIAWPTTYAPLQQYGFKLKVVDVDYDTLCIKTEVARKTWGHSLLVVANILGNPCDLKRLRDACTNNHTFFIEDNCESLGAEIDGAPCGSWGHISTLSFFFSHHISTGEGGMLLTDDKELADIARCLRAHGWMRDLDKDSVLYEEGLDEFVEAYRFLLPGYNVRPTEFAAAAGLVQLSRLDEALRARRKNARLFKNLFDDGRFRLQKEQGQSSWFGFTMICETVDRKMVFNKLRGAGVEFRLITGGNFFQHPASKHYELSDRRERETTACPCAQTVHNCGFFIGNHPYDMSEALLTLKDVLR